ncbi:MAG TPA: bifunctional N(6)-L-threonylcarbamoyladenine synthase/serine/threonine protein kinase [Candidatus Thermoplasmatota archaeon]|nr:bifunctional N(6)-L-threonylcarbamoyladenine synthase/serine/threonine protein kinase [Candidatus Thermoplasmatota archaeon]
MKALGIEGTAHTFAVGIVEVEDPATGKGLRILGRSGKMIRPEKGGIHPREAANHHAEHAGALVREALKEWGGDPRDLDLVAFSQGPGLGPCLRTAATAARSVALSLGKPLVGVNHCVAHLEIGRAMTPAEDPVLLYASGGNTQVIAYVDGKYRVLGETLDIGVGNMLDKFGREMGLPFPAGPELEKLARQASGKLIDLPYTVKGMDVAFSGILTAALSKRDTETMADLAFSLQETVFGMLVEVTERALAHTGKNEVVLGGGVACNERLREMSRLMAEGRGGVSYAPDRSVCVDNGVMIAHTGVLMHAAGIITPLEKTGVDQRFRTDEVQVLWRDGEQPFPRRTEPGILARGAEAVVREATYLGRAAVAKQRVPKAYRHPALDERLRSARTRHEARLLSEARRAGVRTPLVLDAHTASGTLTLERVRGVTLRERLETAGPAEAHGLLQAMGASVARLHRADLVHGDLTTSNVIVPEGAGEDLVILDFGLASVSIEVEDKGTDLHVLMEALEAAHGDPRERFNAFLKGYAAAGGTDEVLRRLDEIVERGRYRGT